LSEKLQPQISIPSNPAISAGMGVQQEAGNGIWPRRNIQTILLGFWQIRLQYIGQP